MIALHCGQEAPEVSSEIAEVAIMAVFDSNPGKHNARVALCSSLWDHFYTRQKYKSSL
jgi:hypothetical protein